jgi:prepilin-type N-terminal cleavage/methylation domain-containing protein
MRRYGKQGRGFTLVELIVVIAIIVILVLFLVPIINSLVGGKSLRMARNSIDGYFGGVRLEAVNRGAPVVVAILPPYVDPTSKQVDRSHTWSLKVGPNGEEEEFGEGLVAFLVDKSLPLNASVHERFQYMNRNLLFAGKFDKNITVHPKKLATWGSVQLEPVLKTELSPLFTRIGLPANTFLIYIREDGLAQIPGDIPGFRIDGDNPDKLDGDIVLTDGKAVLFLDISVVLKVRGRLFRYEELGKDAKYTAPEKQ